MRGVALVALTLSLRVWQSTRVCVIHQTAPAAVSQLAMLRAQQRFKDEDPEAAARLEANAKFAYACCLCTLCLSCIPLCCCTPEASKRRLVELAHEEQRNIFNPSAAHEGGAQSPPARQAMAASDSSGNQQAIRAKELDLKEKELELKERELELQEKEAAAAGN